MKIKKNTFLMSICIILAGVTVYFLVINIAMKRTLLRLEEAKRLEFRDQMLVEREKIKRDFEEKYRADIVSYRAMAARLEAEKKKSREMEKDIKELKGKTGR